MLCQQRRMHIFAAVYDIDLSTLTPIVAETAFRRQCLPGKEAAGVKIDEASLVPATTEELKISVWAQSF